MTEREEPKPRTYLQCDGCGYVVNPKKDHIILTIKREGEESRDLHFHAPMQEGENRSWGSADCLGYWYMNRAARELSMAKHAGKRDIEQARHAGVIAERYPPKAKT